MKLVPSERSAHVTITINDDDEAVEWIRFAFDPLRHRAVTGDGYLTEADGQLVWKPPTKGGTLRYVFSVDHFRDEGAYDARSAKNWAVFRGQDVVPRIRIRTTPDAVSDSFLDLTLPEGWSAAVPYRRIRGNRYDLAESRSRFDRPTGWFAFGKLGIVRETLGDTRIAIVGPAGQGVRRMDTLALLKWTMPSLQELFGKLPKRVQIVIAGDPMWRGGLSAPRSVFLHVERPLISGDGTSPLLHELMHSFMRARSGKGGRWISEGFAEYYSIALLRRSETLTAERYESAIEAIRERAAPESIAFDGEMNSARRARAVLTLMELDSLVRSASGGARNIDDVMRALTEMNRSLTPARLREASKQVAGRDFEVFFSRWPESKPEE